MVETLRGRRSGVAEARNGFHVNRRSLLGMGIASLAVLSPLPVSAAPRYTYERSLAFRHLHTDESLTIVYWEKGQYVPDGLRAINHILRDFRTGEVARISPQLIDLLYAVGRRLGNRQPIHIVSGYRSPATNAMLRRTNGGVAKNSLHMQGKAIDLRIPGFSTRAIAGLGREMRGGGVGYYPRSDFVHLDVGRPRYWRG